MRILLWHGYLLAGSGSNIYTRNIAREWRKDGHDVLCLCQERHPEDFDFIDESGDFREDNLDWSTDSLARCASVGRCRLIRPHIGDILPVYVYDEYEGFIAKRFVDLADDELAAYNSANVTAMITAIERFDPHAIITGHEIMGPYIARDACTTTGASYLTKLHGSALEYAVKEQPERYLSFAQEGLAGASVVTGGSRYMIDEASKVIPGFRHKARVVHPGVDVDLFRPAPRSASERSIVGYVGKLIANKGVHLLLAALGLVGRTDYSVVIVGFGDLEERLRDLWAALSSGDREAALAISDGLAGGSQAPLSPFLRSGDADDGFFARLASIPLEFAGRLDHGPLSTVLPAFDVLVVPSILPEAFGMVAVEAAACAVLPVVPRHSGIGEVGREIEERLGIPETLTYDPDDPIRGIARRVRGLLDLPFEQRRALGLQAADLAAERWSWRRCARELLAHAAGSGRSG